MGTFGSFLLFSGIILVLLAIGTILIANRVVRYRMRETEEFTADCGHTTKLEGTLQQLGKEDAPFMLLINEEGAPAYCFDCLQEAVPDCNDGICSIDGGKPLAVRLN